MYQHRDLIISLILTFAFIQVVLSNQEIRVVRSPKVETGINAINPLLWQGFDHQWERTFLGFQTPHRMGSFGNYFEQPTEAGEGDAYSAHFTFTPGVDGDFAYPALMYESLTQYDDNEIVVDNSQEAVFKFTDSAKNDPFGNPVAETRILRNVTLPISSLHRRQPNKGASNREATEAAANAVLRGFNIDMHCDPDKQPSGKTCNSNGIWPSEITVSIESCHVHANDSLECSLLLVIVREWTPTQGGGKPFNWVMDFVFSFKLTTISSQNQSHLSFTKQPIGSSGEIHEPIKQGQIIITGNTAMSGNIVSTAAFSTIHFQLLGNEKNSTKKGRYLERLVYAIKPLNYSSSSHEMALQYQYGYAAPSTVYRSQIQYHMDVIMIEMKAKDSTPTKDPIQKTVNGKICMDGFGFSCKSHDLNPQVSDTVPIPASKTD